MRKCKKIGCIILCLLGSGTSITQIQAKSPDVSPCSTDVYPTIQNFFQEPKNSMDVIVLGDSNVYRGFSPLILWREQKVASYVMGSPLQAPWLSYYLLEEMVKYQHPKVVLFEINELFANPTGQKVRSCKVINAMPSDATRLKAIKQSVGEFSELEQQGLFKMYTDSFYNNMMSQFLRKDKQVDYQGSYKGYYLNTAVDPMLSSDRDYMNRELPNVKMKESNKEYIDKIVELCHQKKISLVFVKLPTKQWAHQKDVLARDYAKEKKIPYFDMNTEMRYETMDWNQDTKDKGNHLNDFGAEKVTKELSVYLKQNYSLEPTSNKMVELNYALSLKAYEMTRESMIKTDSKRDEQ